MKELNTGVPRAGRRQQLSPQRLLHPGDAPRTPTSAPPQGPRPNTRELKRGAPVCPPVPLGGRSRALIPTPHLRPKSLPPQVLVIFSVSIRKVTGSGAPRVPASPPWLCWGGKSRGAPCAPGDPRASAAPAPCTLLPASRGGGDDALPPPPPPGSSRATAGGLQGGGDGDVSLRGPSAVRSR